MSWAETILTGIVLICMVLLCAVVIAIGVKEGLFNGD